MFIGIVHHTSRWRISASTVNNLIYTFAVVRWVVQFGVQLQMATLVMHHLIELSSDDFRMKPQHKESLVALWEALERGQLPVLPLTKCLRQSKPGRSM